jgi:hypothetical protein
LHGAASREKVEDVTTRTRWASATLAALTAATLLTAAPPAGASGDHGPRRVPPLSFRGEATLPAGAAFAGTVVGGLSSITYDAWRDVYYAISDAQPNLNLPGVEPPASQGPFRFYTLRIDVRGGSLEPGDVSVVDVTTLTDAAGAPLPAGTVDPEGLALTRRRTLIVTSEGFAQPGNAVAPFVREFSLDGRQLRELDLPGYVEPVVGVSGVRNNLGLESAAVTPGGRFLFTGFENALVQDGTAATLTTGSPSRLLRYDTRSGRLERQYVYLNDPVAEPPVPAGQFTVNGLVELLPLNSQFLLSMERSFSVGAGNTVRLHGVALPGATDVNGVADLDDAGAVRPARKHLLLDLDELGLPLDNLEGMTLGPRLHHGRRALVLVSDNNFTPGQVSQFLLFSARTPGH